MSSRIGHFHRNIICNEQKCVNYLKNKQLLPQNEENHLTYIKVKFKRTVTLRCTKKRCQTVLLNDPF